MDVSRLEYLDHKPEDFDEVSGHGTEEVPVEGPAQRRARVDELAARTALRPRTGNVTAFPVRPPLHDLGGDAA